MALEIERKFLVETDGWRAAAGPGVRLRQGYLGLAGRDGVTVRIRQAGPRAFLTVKGPGTLVRAEFEYEVPLAEAEAMLATLCARPLLEKTRHDLVHAGQDWTVDVYSGALEGLVVAEAELAAPDQPLALPAWLGREITADLRYRNSVLASEGLPQPA